jgi:DNA adenine methylase
MLFRTLQNPASATRLLELLSLTPFARDEFRLSSAPTDDPVERSRRMIIRAFMGFGSNAHNEKGMHFRPNVRWPSGGFRPNSNASGTTPARDWSHYPDALLAIVKRFSQVVIENADARKVMEQHDSPVTLHYCDPPYLPETRAIVAKKARSAAGSVRAYAHELTTADHGDLLAFLKTLSGMVVLSGYPSPLYDEALAGWKRVTTEAMADGARPRTEVLWINPAAVAALERQRCAGTLFERTIA